MLYLGNASSPAIREAMRTGEIGMMCTPSEGRTPDNAAVWAADNSCFGNNYPGDAAWLSWLAKLTPHADRCLWATAPDIVGDAAGTLDRSLPHLPVIRAIGYRAALVAQDGLERLPVPWDQFDVLFLGGSTSFKLGHAAVHLAQEALSRGKNVHMGRVNSARRWDYAQRLGCRSADGTFLTYAPDTNLDRLRRWMRSPVSDRQCGRHDAGGMANAA